MNGCEGLVRRTVGQTIRFGLIGAMNTVIDLVVFFLLIRFAHWDAVVAQTISYTCGLINSYAWNRTVTFHRAGRPGFAEVVRFVALNALSYGLSAGGLLVLSELAWPMGLCKVVVTSLTVVLNFIGSKWWVFASNGQGRGLVDHG